MSTVIIAGAIAWVMQEGSARLTLASGHSLGEAVRLKTTQGWAVVGRYAFACFVLVGNFAYECNNFAGTGMLAMHTSYVRTDSAAVEQLSLLLCTRSQYLRPTCSFSHQSHLTRTV